MGEVLSLWRRKKKISKGEGERERARKRVTLKTSKTPTGVVVSWVWSRTLRDELVERDRR